MGRGAGYRWTRFRRAGLAVALSTLVWAVVPVDAGATSDPDKGTITGRVTDAAGNPVGPESDICARVGAESRSSSNLDADGNYRIEDVSPGVWSVAFDHCTGDPADWTYAPEFYPDIHERESAAGAGLPNITVRAGETVTGIDARLETGAGAVVTVVTP